MLQVRRERVVSALRAWVGEELVGKDAQVIADSARNRRGLGLRRSRTRERRLHGIEERQAERDTRAAQKVAARKGVPGMNGDVFHSLFLSEKVALATSC